MGLELSWGIVWDCYGTNYDLSYHYDFLVVGLFGDYLEIASVDWLKGIS